MLLDTADMTFITKTSDFSAVITNFDVNFTNESIVYSDSIFDFIGQENATYSWDFGNGNTSSNVDPYHTYTAGDDNKYD